LLAAFSLGVLQAGFGLLGIYTLLLLTAAVRARLPLGEALVELRWMAWFLLLVFAARLLASPAEPLADATIFSISTSRQGLVDGSLICWRMALVAAAGVVFSTISRPREIRSAVEWILQPVPLVPGRRTALMIGLLVRFGPHILAATRLTAEAQRARGVENRKNPFYRLTRLAVPVMRRTFVTADRLTLAMEARGYHEDIPSPPLPPASASDYTALCTALVLVLPGAFY
jgi:energy-coupling factor transporter transmembrane protein EcfT